MGDKRTHYIGCAVTSEEKDYIEEEAKDHQMKVSEYIRFVLLTQRKGEEIEKAEYLYSISDAAKILGSSRTTVYALIHKGRIAFVEVGSHKKIRKNDLESYIQKSYKTDADYKEDNRLWHIHDIAQYLGVSKQTARIYLKNGYIKSHKVGKFWVAYKEDVESFKGAQNAVSDKETPYHKNLQH